MRALWRQLGILGNWPVFLAVAILSALGIVSIASRSPADAQKQFIFLLIGLGIMLVMQLGSYMRIGRYAWAFYVVSLLLLLYTVTPGVPQTGLFSVPDHRGQKNWINFGFINLQPAEMAKVSVCLLLARFLRFRSNYRNLKGLLAPFGLVLVPLVLILKQPDLGSALVFIPALFVVMFAAGAKLRHLLGITALGVVFGLIAWLAGDKPRGPGLPVFKHLPVLVQPYQRARVHSMFSNDPDVLKKAGFQQLQAETAFGSGSWTGKGALSVPVGRHVPEAHNDMIFALIGEQFGFVGAVVLIGAYLILLATGIEIAAGTREPFGRLTAVGIVAMLAGQTFMNLMVTLKLMPVTGVTLPFVSYGGSSLLACCLMAGLLLNISQNRPVVMAKDAFEFD